MIIADGAGGLPGKSFASLIVGFGCNVPAIMATRTLEKPRDRIMTIVMAPFMSCGARLPVYALFAAAFFPVGGQNVVFGLYLIGIAVAVFTGLILKRTLLQGETTPFIMELPPYHLPTVKGILIRSWERTKGFMFRAGLVIVPLVLVLNVLNTMGTDGSFGHEDTDRSVLSEVGRGIAPAFSPMGLDAENWLAAVGIFTGVLAKEAVVGTLDSMYTAMARADAGVLAEPDEAFSVLGGLAAANRFDIDPEALRPMLAILEHKGRVRRLHGGVSCNCNKASCNQTMPEWYEAVTRRPGGDRNRRSTTCAATSRPGPARVSSSES